MVNDLSVIIINYKSGQLVVDCLSTVLSETKNILIETIVVDNDSKDDSKEFILSKFPAVRWFEMGYNSGFARANNEGIRQSTGEIVLLLNPDTLVKGQVLENCFQSFKASEYVACGVQLLNADLSPQISGNYFMKGGLNYLLPLPYLGTFFKWSGNIFNVKRPNVPDSDSKIEVDWINGAFLMVKKNAIKNAGLLDEDFFLYAEEAEWCSRLGKIGKLCIWGELKAIHLQGATAVTTFNSTDRSYGNLFDQKGQQIMLSNLVRIRKQFGAMWFLVMLFFYCGEIPVFFVGILLSKLIPVKNRKYFFPQFNGYRKNLFSVIKLSLVIIRNRPYFYKVL